MCSRQCLEMDLIRSWAGGEILESDLGFWEFEGNMTLDNQSNLFRPLYCYLCHKDNNTYLAFWILLD